mmetsp:Transcript_115111/g.287661  ORF Transcript_115111/g.287661 Transcript_115111/m.287661 type:complete len:223 (-) Transcript_115111:836-1504(-)
MTTGGATRAGGASPPRAVIGALPSAVRRGVWSRHRRTDPPGLLGVPASVAARGMAGLTGAGRRADRARAGRATACRLLVHAGGSTDHWSHGTVTSGSPVRRRDVSLRGPGAAPHGGGRRPEAAVHAAGAGEVELLEDPALPLEEQPVRGCDVVVLVELQAADRVVPREAVGLQFVEHVLVEVGAAGAALLGLHGGLGDLAVPSVGADVGDLEAARGVHCQEP